MTHPGRPDHPCVLVIDDEPVIRELLRRHLTKLGCEVAVAESGEQALTRLSQVHPDLVLLDMRMPGMGGMECLNRLRQLYPQVPVVILTAVVERESVLEAINLGAQEYLFKPIDLETVTRIVQNQLSPQT